MWLEAIEREDYRFASLEAILYNKFWPDEIPWTVDDVLGKSTDRATRKRSARKSKVSDKLTTQRMMIAASKPGDLPDWVQQLEANRKRVN